MREVRYFPYLRKSLQLSLHKLKLKTEVTMVNNRHC